MRQSLEICFRLALDGAQKRYRDVVSNFPVSSREISVSIEARLSPFVSRHLGVHGACSFLPGSSSRSPGLRCGSRPDFGPRHLRAGRAGAASAARGLVAPH